MAIIEELNENDSQSQEFSNVTESDNPAPVAEPEEKSVLDDIIPEKYKGKSVAEIAKMHEEAEKLIGRQANEVGELRKLTDEILKQQLSANKPAQKQEEAPEVDFWSDPDTYLNKKLESHPDILAAKQAQLQMKHQQASEALHKKHPDMLEVVQSKDFQDWVAASKVRTQLYVAADTQFDTDSADELLSTYKAIKGVKATEEVQQQVKNLAETRTKQLKAATVDAGGGNETSKKIYRRADLIRLKMTDPARYEALEPEIYAAYQEGRVK